MQNTDDTDRMDPIAIGFTDFLWWRMKPKNGYSISLKSLSHGCTDYNTYPCIHGPCFSRTRNT